jgi:hypothetical protein
MSGTNTNGFDIVVQLTEKAINDGLKMLPGPNGTPPGTFPLTEVQQIILPITSAISVPYDVQLELDKPSVQLQPSSSGPGGVTVICNLGPSSELTSVGPVPLGIGSLFSQVPLNGSVHFVCPLAAPNGVEFGTTPWPNTPVSGMAVFANLTNPVVTFIINPVNVGTLVGGTLIPVDLTALQNKLAQAFTDLSTQMGDLPLTTPIPLLTGPNPVQRLADVQGRILAPPPGDSPALALGLLSQQSKTAQGQNQGLGPENIAGITQTAGLVGGAVDVANFWLIELVCQTIQNSPGFQGVSFVITASPPAGTFTGSVQINPPSGNAFTLNSMSVTVNPSGGIDINGSGSMSGFCYSATFTFMGTLTFACDPVNGVTASLASPLAVSANASIPWYCWLAAAVVLGLIAGALGGWIVGLIVGVITAIVLASINPGLPNLPSISNIPGLFTGPGLPLPFPVGSPGLIVSQCQFDDLGVQGVPAYIDLEPRLSSGDDLTPPGRGFDLDLATVSLIQAPIPTNIDLVWTGNSIDAANGCRFSIVNSGFDVLTLTDLQQLSYSLSTIPASQIPLFVLPWWWLWGLPLPAALLGPPLVFGARTIEGLYTKCAAWRQQGMNQLYLQFETYVGTTVNFCLDVLIETTSLTVVDQDEEACFDTKVEPVPEGAHHCPGVEIIHTKDLVLITQLKRAQRIKVHARPQLFVVPVSYQWTVLGVSLGTGHGPVTINGTTVNYDATSPFLEIIAPMGVDVIGQICVLAIDADGRQCQACVSIYRPGTMTLGGCHPCGQPSSFDEVNREIARLNRLNAGASAAAKRLRVLTAGVQVQAVPPVPVSEALRELVSR